MADDVDTEISDSEITDEELTALALAADPDVALADGAVPFRSLDPEGVPLLPEWYMPGSPSRARHDWRSRVSIGIAVGLVVINGFGICVTYGIPQIF